MNKYYSSLKKFNIAKPARYVDFEYKGFSNKWRDDYIKVLFAFPDLYEIGKSFIGFPSIYNYVLSKKSDIIFDEIFAPDIDMLEAIQNKKIPFLSLHYKKELFSFDIVGFTIQTELCITTILKMLELGNIPVYSRDRNSDHPFIIFGGSGSYNPEPYANFADFFVVGDGEEVFLEIVNLLEKNKDKKKYEKLRLLAKVKGIYVPSFYKPIFKGLKFNGHKVLEDSLPSKISKRIFDINKTPLKKVYGIPLIKPVFDRLVIEIMRGCLNGCRFCQAGFINRPLREKSIEKIVEEMKEGIKETGYDEVSFLSLSVSDYPNIDVLIKNIMPFLNEKCISLSLPSLRIDKFPISIAKEISKVRRTTFTFAPEAGSDRLRKVINKNITNDEIFRAIEKVFQNGWQNIKFYFMLGLPTETDEDVKAIVDMLFKSYKIAKKFTTRFKISVTLSPFNPKPHTPFQWCDRKNNDYFLEKAKYIKDKLKKIRRVSINYHNLEMSLVESFIARADRRASEVIYQAYLKGCYLDTWDSYFKKDIWLSLLDNFEKKYQYNIFEPYDISSPLPWDIIDSYVKKEFLIKEFKKAKSESLTPNCRNFKNCKVCGACSNKRKHILEENKNGKHFYINLSDEKFSDKNFRYWLIFSKRFPLTYVGHLDFIRNINFVFRRTNLPFVFTEGFHPKIKMSFYDALGLFIESEAEIMEIELKKQLPEKEILSILNQNTLNGLNFKKVIYISSKSLKLNKNILVSKYELFFERNIIDKNISYFLKKNENLVKFQADNFKLVLFLKGHDKKILKTLSKNFAIKRVVKKDIYLMQDNKLVLL